MKKMNHFLKNGKSINRIYLMGFMGRGKSTVGRQLSILLNVPFLDFDDIIAEREGKPIAEIFNNHGETYFREKETEYLKSIDRISPLIISLGGGTPCSEQNINFISNDGITVYLNLNPADLAVRLFDQSMHRPLLSAYNTLDSLTGFIENKLSQRALFYNKADIITDGRGSVEDAANRIYAALKSSGYLTTH